jgi:hypothetical protein
MKDGEIRKYFNPDRSLPEYSYDPGLIVEIFRRSLVDFDPNGNPLEYRSPYVSIFPQADYLYDSASRLYATYTIYTTRNEFKGSYRDFSIIVSFHKENVDELPNDGILERFGITKKQMRHLLDLYDFLFKKGPTERMYDDLWYRRHLGCSVITASILLYTEDILDASKRVTTQYALTPDVKSSLQKYMENIFGASQVLVHSQITTTDKFVRSKPYWNSKGFAELVNNMKYRQIEYDEQIFDENRTDKRLYVLPVSIRKDWKRITTRDEFSLYCDLLAQSLDSTFIDAELSHINPNLKCYIDEDGICSLKNYFNEMTMVRK